jgi:hypothetical protein
MQLQIYKISMWKIDFAIQIRKAFPILIEDRPLYEDLAKTIESIFV